MRETLVAARLNDLDLHTRAGKSAAAQRLLDLGDRVVWTDGGTERSWTLPDQVDIAGVPRLAAVVVATSRTQVADGGPGGDVTVLLLVGVDGTTLARVAQASFDLTDLYDQHNLDRIWPSAVFDAVRTRGVDHRTESYDRPSDLEAAHPGSVSTALMFSGENAHRVTLWLVGVVLLALLVGWLLVRR